MRKKTPFSYFILVLLLIFGFIAFFPIYMAIINSFKDQGEIFNSVLAFPTSFRFENYTGALERINILQSALNTLIVTVIGLTGITICSSMAGWKLSRTSGKLSNLFFIFFLSSMLVPFHAIMISITRVATTLSIQDNVIGLGFIYIGLGVNLAIFLYHGFVKSVPRELEESARMDGCGELQIFLRIVFPLLKPITATILILNSLWVWNDFLLPLIMLSNVNNQTLILAINALFGEFHTDWPKVLAALIMVSLPVLIFYIIFQKNIMKGIAEGAIKS
ncbi:MAG: carbohydrate ABC transporter permease [Lachnospiraceae bacterium]|nr:carbohydrate ABC transporter permease [Lachnospiraceae bacterium]